MPHSISAKKRVRQTESRRRRNQTIKSRIRTVRRRFLKAMESGDLAATKEHLRQCERLLHRASTNGPIHRNTAARLISRMHERLRTLEKAAS